MTLKDADLVAQRMSPVEEKHTGVVYTRILEIGYHYGKDGKKTPFICLQDKSGHSVTYADPTMCNEVERQDENIEN